MDPRKEPDRSRAPNVHEEGYDRGGDTVKEPLELRISRWALRDSKPRPSPCKGDQNVQVSHLSRQTL